MRLPVLAIAICGCGFSPTKGDSDPDPDAALPVIDAGGDAGCASWLAIHFDGCAIGDAQPAFVFPDGESFFDTDTGTLTTPGGDETALATLEITVADGPNLSLVFFESLSIPSGSTLRPIGSRALLLASDDQISIAGLVDARGRTGLSLPAGSGFDAHCDSPNGVDDGSGGGGGGFGTGGADGGGTDVGLGGPGGTPVDASEYDIIRPGCDGGIGLDENQVESIEAVGGLAGGAIQFSARNGISIEGSAVLSAGGGGGQSASGNRTGGGGGGSGGYIGLDSPVVTLAGGALLLVNGGAGGEGTGQANNGVPGQDSLLAAVAANGGSGGAGSGGDGGDGSAMGTPATQGQNGVNSGGGGGGGLGVVRCASCQ